jgi:ketosteroid isomerase-like protein
MPAKDPKDICRLFQQAMADGDLESALNLYDSEAVFVKQTGEVAKGKQALKRSWPRLPGENLASSTTSSR